MNHVGDVAGQRHEDVLASPQFPLSAATWICIGLDALFAVSAVIAGFSSALSALRSGDTFAQAIPTILLFGLPIVLFVGTIVALYQRAAARWVLQAIAFCVATLLIYATT